MVPTVSRAIGPPNPYKYWWLRSPSTGWDVSVGYVDPSGDVYGNNVNDSYGRLTR